jgi:hypothetical protein
LTDFPDLVSIVVGLIGGLIPAYIMHKLSVRQSRKERFIPYLQKLYGIVSRIMKNAEAEKLSDRYKSFVNAKIEGRMREIAIKDLGKEQVNEPPYSSPEFVPYTFFVISYDKLIEIVRECRNFESVYSEMVSTGLLPALKVRDETLARFLSFFHDSTEYIVNETSGYFDKLMMTNETKTAQEFESRFQGEVFQRMLKLSISTRNLFNFGAELEKRLKKYV